MYVPQAVRHTIIYELAADINSAMSFSLTFRAAYPQVVPGAVIFAKLILGVSGPTPNSRQKLPKRKRPVKYTDVLIFQPADCVLQQSGQ